MKIKECLSQLIGRTISGVVVTSGAHPRSQLILTFSDGTAMEFWSNEGPIEMAGNLDQESLDKIIAITCRSKERRVSVFRASHRDSEKPQRELF